MTISQALQKLYKKITTHDSTETNIAALIADLAQNYPESGGGASVSIDKTLTQEGQAADAKTVGDKLAEKLDKSAALTVDTTLAQAGKAADAQAVGTKLSEKADKTTAATKEALGLVKQAAAVADAAGEQPTKAEFDALLAALRAAGVLAAS